MMAALYVVICIDLFLNCAPRWQTASVLLSTCGLPSALCQEAAHLREGRCLGMICMKSYPSPSECRQTENHSHRKLTNLITGPQPCLTQWNYEPCHVGLPRMVGSCWRVLTECGPLEKGMASHFIIPALRTPWTVWKGKMIGYWKTNSMVGAQYATGDQWRNNFSKNEEIEPKQKQHLVVDVTGDKSKVWCCKEQYCIGTWDVRSMNQGKLEVVKQELKRVNINILGISELIWTGGWI